MRDLPMAVLRSFVAVADMGGVTTAGARVGRSQPAVSLQIKRLEQGLGRALFSRQGRQLALTAEGQVLYACANKILGLNDEVVAQLMKPALSGNIRLGTPSEFATTLLPKVVGEFARAYPQVALEVVCDLSKNLLAPERRREFDLVLALQDDTTHHSAALVKVDELVWVAGRAGVSLDAEPVRLAMAPPPCIYRSRALQVLEQHKLPWRIVYTNPDLTGLQAAIVEGLGITALARSVVPANLQIIAAGSGLPPLGEVGISLAYDRRRNDEALLRLVEFLRASLSRTGGE